MQHLSELVSNTLETVKRSPVKLNTLARGLTVAVGNPMTQLAKSRTSGLADPQMVSRIANQLLSTSLWPIEPTVEIVERRAALITEALTPVSFEDAGYWLARFLHHFPSPKGVERDSVIISDLAADCEREGFGIGAMLEALTQMRQSATAANPFMPPTGVILAEIRRKNDLHKKTLTRDLFYLEKNGK